MARPLTILISFLSGLVIGVGATRFAVGRGPELESPADRTPSAELGGTPGPDLAELAAEIRSLRQSLEMRDSAAARTPASGEDPRITQLLADFHALAGRVTDGADFVGGHTRRTDLLSGIGATGKPSFAEIDALSDISMPSLDRVSDEWTTAHMLWTIPEIVERYGMPKNIWATSERSTLQYHRLRADGGRVLIDFTVTEGIVTRVWVNR